MRYDPGMIRRYFDANATTPLDPRVAEEMTRVARDFPGNPSSAHGAGRAARAVLEDARERIAAHLEADPRGLVFTSGGTEANNLAILGAAQLAGSGHVVTSAVEHPSVLRVVERLGREGFETTKLPVDGEGRTDPAALAAALRPDTFLATVMLANNETGTIHPVAALAAAARERGVPFHADAVQGVGKIPVSVRDLGVDLLSAGAHKLGGPRGVGLLWIRPGTRVGPILAGGRQEGGLRPGTVPVALAAGFAKALDLAVDEREERTTRLKRLRERLAEGILALGDVRRNSPRDGCLPNTLNVTVRGASGEALLIALDREGFCVATGSACASGSALPSHVLGAMGLDPREVTSSIRLSLHAGTEERDVDDLLAALAPIAARLRAVSGPREP